MQTTRVTIRRATRADIPAIVRIERASFGSHAWECEALLDYLAKPDSAIFLVAVARGKVAGYAIGYHGPNRAEVDSIAVSPPHRRSGVGQALIVRLKRMLGQRGFSKVSLSVRLDNTAAIALYRKLGFRRERRINGYYEDGAPAWRMGALF
jgi:[ribosomal protein S18]-alanine N-acetyltransferase